MTEVIGTAADYDQLVDVLKARKNALGLSDAVLEDLANLARGHAGKLFGEARAKMFGMLSLFAVADTLAVSFQVVEDPAKRVGIEPEWSRRIEFKAKNAQVRTGDARRKARLGPRLINRALPDVRREIAKRANVKRNETLTPKQRSRIARKAAAARWGDKPRWKARRERRKARAKRSAGRARDTSPAASPKCPAPVSRQPRSAGIAAATGPKPRPCRGPTGKDLAF